MIPQIDALNKQRFADLMQEIARFGQYGPEITWHVGIGFASEPGCAFSPHDLSFVWCVMSHLVCRVSCVVCGVLSSVV